MYALKRASEQTTGGYEHRRTALQEVRFAIEDLRPDVEYEHRLRDFNNEARTTFDEIRLVLSTARSRVAERLALVRAQLPPEISPTVIFGEPMPGDFDLIRLSRLRSL